MKPLTLPSPPGKGEKVAGGRMRGLFAGSGPVEALKALGAAGTPRFKQIDDREHPERNA